MIHVLLLLWDKKTWMAGTSPAMTERGYASANRGARFSMLARTAYDAFARAYDDYNQLITETRYLETTR